MERQRPSGHAAAPREWQHRAFIAVTIAIGIAICTAAARELLYEPLSPAWLALLTLTALAGWATLRVPAMPISFSISDTFTVVAALIIGPAAGAITAAVDGLVLSFRMANDRRTVARVLFNIAGLAIATWVAGQVFFALAGDQPLREGTFGALRLLALLTVFGAVHFGLNSGIVAVAIALERGATVGSIWREHFASLWLSSLGGVFAALLMMALARSGPLETLILIAPLPVILYVTLRHALGRAEDQITHLGTMNRVYLATIEALAQAVDAKDQVTHDHVQRVQENATRLAGVLGVHDDAELQAIRAASLLHDIGKIAIPEHILNKPGKLTAPEFEVMKTHAAIGADILAVIGFPYPLAPIVRHHHENWDGTGYPDGLAGEAVPIGARILQVVDCFDALTSDRPYRPAMTGDEAMGIIIDRRGTMYDPRVVGAMRELHAAGGLLTPEIERAAPAAATAAPAAPAPASSAAVAGASTQADTEMASAQAFAMLGATLTRAAGPAEAGACVWNALRTVIPGSACALFAYEPSADALRAVFTAGEPTLASGELVPVGERLSGWVAATRRGMLNSDARLDLANAAYDATALRAALAVPVVDGDQLHGVLTFYARDPQAFSELHLRLAEAAARVVTPAMHTTAPALRAVAV